MNILLSALSVLALVVTATVLLRASNQRRGRDNPFVEREIRHARRRHTTEVGK